MKFIFKNTHICINMLPWLKFSKKITRKVTFTEASKYILYDGSSISVDQEDLNKLFGFTSGIFGRFGKKVENSPKQDLPYYYSAAHWNSARFVWRYNPSTDKMEITWYVYDNAIRLYNVADICTLDFNREYYMTILKNKQSYTFIICELDVKSNDTEQINEDMSIEIKNYNKIWEKEIKVSSNISIFGKVLTLFFGGNRTAPCNIKIKM